MDDEANGSHDKELWALDKLDVDLMIGYTRTVKIFSVIQYSPLQVDKDYNYRNKKK